MEKKKSQTPSQAPQQLRHTFRSKLERIAVGMDYFALSVPEELTDVLGTRGPVPVVATVNGSESFLASLYPLGGGRHGLRVKKKICKSAGIDAGDLVEVHITMRDRSAEVGIPEDVEAALRAKGVWDEFEALPDGKKSYLLRLIAEAAKPETRSKRIQAAIEEAKRRQESRG